MVKCERPGEVELNRAAVYGRRLDIFECAEGKRSQARACWALSRIGTAASLPALRALSNDRRASQRLRKSAIEAMQKILEREQRLAVR